MKPTEWIIKNGAMIQLTLKERLLDFLALAPVEGLDAGHLWNVGICKDCKEFNSLAVKYLFPFI